MIRRARVPALFLAAGAPPGAELDGDGCVLLDVAVAGGRVARIRPADADASDEPAIDLAGRHLWPTLLDMHAHLDKAHTVARTPNPDGTFTGARDATAADRIGFWDADDLRRRMTFGLRCAEAHGVGAIRTHLDSPDDGPHRDQAATTWGVFRALRDEWAGRVTLQGSAWCPSTPTRRTTGVAWPTSSPPAAASSAA